MTEATTTTGISALEQQVRDRANQQLGDRLHDLFAPIFAKIDDIEDVLLQGVEIDGHTADAGTVLERIMDKLQEALAPGAEQAAIDRVLAAAEQLQAAAEDPTPDTKDAA